MESVNGKNVTAGDLPPAERGAGHQASQSEAVTACHELCGFLQDGLGVAQETVQHTLDLQLAMMDVVSRHILNLRGAEPPVVDPEAMLELVMAIQSDDLMRQRHENLARALAVMSQAVQDIRALTEAGIGQQPPTDELRRRWTADLLKTLTLDEMRQGFEQGLETREGD